ncbi:MAG: hypothetical protein AB4080_02080 [Trichodesmium sp.]
MKLVLKDFNYNFQPSQIVCLEHENTCLYAEVIQVLEKRKMCWVRPLLLKESIAEVDSENHHQKLAKSNLWDLRDGADLVWPICLFREAIDTEFIPLLTELELLESKVKDLQISHQQLKDFVSQVWQAYPEVFPLVKE